jgi:hypothetical protein
VHIVVFLLKTSCDLRGDESSTNNNDLLGILSSLLDLGLVIGAPEYMHVIQVDSWGPWNSSLSTCGYKKLVVWDLRSIGENNFLILFVDILGFIAKLEFDTIFVKEISSSCGEL